MTATHNIRTEDWDGLRLRWQDLPLLKRGESKEIRVVNDDLVMVCLIPSLYSFTQNRSATIAGTDSARLRSFEILTKVLRAAGLQVAVVAFGDDYYITRRLRMHGQDHVPPIEVIVKARHVGTPKHALYRISDHLTRDGDRILPGQPHLPYVRFDYTNPLTDDAGQRLRDECLPTGLADRFIDTTRAEQTAIAAFCSLYGHLSQCGIRLDDICFKIDHTGQVIFGEVSPDCMRAVWLGNAPDFFANPGEDRSKDTFRAGSQPQEVRDSYDRFVAALETPCRPAISPFSCPLQTDELKDVRHRL
jgi:phosphoribosylaminoimidazole-succinocarboxamide synthase